VFSRWNTNTNTHHLTKLILCIRYCLFTIPTYSLNSVSFVWTTVNDMQCFKQSISWNKRLMTFCVSSDNADIVPNSHNKEYESGTYLYGWRMCVCDCVCVGLFLLVWCRNYQKMPLSWQFVSVDLFGIISDPHLHVFFMKFYILEFIENPSREFNVLKMSRSEFLRISNHTFYHY
jgi:hypothetical protein